MFLLPSLITGQSFIPILLPVQEFWKFYFIRDWSDIQKSETFQYLETGES